MSEQRLSQTVDINNLTVMQLSFSTAELEKSIFFSPEFNANKNDMPVGNIVMLAVHGDLYILQEASPEKSIPLTEEAGVFRIIGLDQQD